MHTIEFYCLVHRHHRLRMRKTGPSWFYRSSLSLIASLGAMFTEGLHSTSTSEECSTLTSNIRLLSLGAQSSFLDLDTVQNTPSNASFILRTSQGHLLMRIHVDVYDNAELPCLGLLASLARRLLKLGYFTSFILIIRVPPTLHVFSQCLEQTGRDTNLRLTLDDELRGH